MTLSERIKKLCATKGITLAELERILGLGNGSIRKWEIVSSPSVANLQKVADYFGVSTDYLLGRSPVPHSASALMQQHRGQLTNQPVPHSATALMRQHDMAENILSDLTEEQMKQMEEFADFLRSQNKKE